MRKLINAKVSSMKELTAALLDFADRFSFVVREGVSVSKASIELLEGLNPYLIGSTKLSAWPGTKLLGGQASLYSFFLNNETAFLLCRIEDNLFKWLLPHLPEDLVFYKNNKPLFVSVTHEQDAYFELDEHDEIYVRNWELI